MTGFFDTGTDSSDPNATQAASGRGLNGWLSTITSLLRSGGAQVSDQQISGVRANGDPEGVMLTHAQEQGLVLMPFDGSNSVTLLGTNSGWSRQFPENPDGSYSGVSFSIAPGLNAGIAQWRCRGRAAGARFNGAFMASVKSLGFVSFMVDGIAYPIRPYPLTYDTGVADVLTYDEQQFVIHDLPDGDHLCQFWVSAPPAGSPNTVLRLLGYLVDKAAGYLEPQRIGVLDTSILLTNAMVSLRAGLDASDAVVLRPRGIRGILYYNTDTVAHTVQFASGPNTNIIYEIPLGAAGATTAPYSSAIFPSTDLGAFSSYFGDWLGLFHKADVGAKVNSTVLKES